LTCIPVNTGSPNFFTGGVSIPSPGRFTFQADAVLY
jgi:hypothetical protein